MLLTLNLYLPRIHFAQELELYSKSETVRSPEIRSAPKPEIRSTPEKDIPKKKSGWLWLILGVMGGYAYYLEQEKDTGSYTATW